MDRAGQFAEPCREGWDSVYFRISQLCFINGVNKYVHICLPRSSLHIHMCYISKEEYCKLKKKTLPWPNINLYIHNLYHQDSETSKHLFWAVATVIADFFLEGVYFPTPVFCSSTCTHTVGAHCVGWHRLLR